jgi:hypothetical protein
MTILLAVAVIYVAFHIGHSHSKWTYHRRQPFYKRIWLSVPGPFGTRIGKRV